MVKNCQGLNASCLQGEDKGACFYGFFFEEVRHIKGKNSCLKGEGRQGGRAVLKTWILRRVRSFIEAFLVVSLGKEG
ncbi:MAG: hypothetical protein COB67_00710 [SAR324 cluster bacterium]|uniref:Uncharacterized protein n=1 Tax=SAR324 cluster bacterium TaxID=2024889 RepID=A0A2A4TC44_9DELT|nr:MAG: hypothetical protein COB67_00710 [SAR324 cluster bacterium]